MTADSACHQRPVFPRPGQAGHGFEARARRARKLQQLLCWSVPGAQPWAGSGGRRWEAAPGSTGGLCRPLASLPRRPKPQTPEGSLTAGLRAQGGLGRHVEVTEMESPAPGQQHTRVLDVGTRLAQGCRIRPQGPTCTGNNGQAGRRRGMSPGQTQVPGVSPKATLPLSIQATAGAWKRPWASTDMSHPGQRKTRCRACVLT